MSNSAQDVIQLFIRHGHFATPDEAILALAHAYVQTRIEQQQQTIEQLQDKYRMSYDEFGAYLEQRAAEQIVNADPGRGRELMIEEEDALEWKSARGLLESWQALSDDLVAYAKSQ